MLHVKKLLLTLLLMPLLGSYVTHAQNLIPNGGFENDLSNWWTNAGNDSEATFSIITENPAEGSKALKVDVITPGGNSWDVQAIHNAWASTPGKVYTLTFWAKAATEGSSFKAVMQNNSYTEMQFTVTEEWEQYEWTFTAAADNPTLRLQFPTAGTFFIDGISIPGGDGGGNGDGEGNGGGDGSAPVIVEAESGNIPPSDPPALVILEEGDITFVSVQENFVEPPSSPGNENRVITYTITFPEAGTYDLYAKIRVGSAGFNDDSFYYGDGFGTKTVTDGDQWITVNGLSPVGFTADDESLEDEIVTGGGIGQNQVWKWINLSVFTGGETPVSFTVNEGELTQTFQIGSRENGLDIDKIAFGLSDVYYTVGNLNRGEGGTTTPPAEPYTPTGDPIATGHTKFLGNVYSNSQIPYFENYWNQVTPENAGKWGSIEGSRDVMNWTEMDAAYDFAKQNGFPIRFHVLIWGNQQPNWIESLSPEEQLEEIEEWFAAVAERYPDLDFIEVVNEPLHDPPNQAGSGGGNYIEALGGSGATGWDWVLNSFRLARKYFPDTPLMINDYSIVNSRPSTLQYIEIINLLKAEGLIDVIGVQGHAFSTSGSVEAMAENLDLLAETGLPIQVTELDIDGLNDQTQLESYQRIFPLFWEHPAVMGITLWGWKPGMWRTPQGAFLAEEDGAERPALVWLREYVNGSISENNPPEITPDQTFEISEGASDGTVVGLALATDTDENTTLQKWQITGGSGAAIFAIDYFTGEITVDDPSLLDYETTTSYTLTVAVSDGIENSVEETIVIDLTNENDNAPEVLASQSFAIDEGVCNVIGTLEATDADDTNDPEFTQLQGWEIVNGTGAFAIDPATGEISVANPSMVDFSKSSVSFMVRVSDGENTSSEEVVTVTIPSRLNVCIKGRVTVKVPRQAVGLLLKRGNCLGACHIEEDKKHNPFTTMQVNIQIGFKAYPNPVKDQLTISLGDNEFNIQSIEIQDFITARTLVKMPVNGKTMVIPRGNLKPGVYLLRARGEKEITQRIVIE